MTTEALDNTGTSAKEASAAPDATQNEEAQDSPNEPKDARPISEDLAKDRTFKTQSLSERFAGIAVDTAPDLTVLRNQVVNTLREWYLLASDSISTLLEGRLLLQPSKDVWLLGKHYELHISSDEQQGWLPSYPEAVLDDFSHLIWCTYRSQYPPIAPSAFTSDAGWGCMLRAGQTLLAQALQLHHFGRDWKFDWNSGDDKDVRMREQYIGIVKQFLDDFASTSLFSIHRMASLGKQREGKDIGEWFGPYGTAIIIRELAQQAGHELSVYTTTDGVVYLADVCGEDFKPTLILVASMLGIDYVNPVYYPFIQASLTLPQSAGIAGGKPSSALYFAGFQGDELIYLDPHYTRPAVPHRQDSKYSQSDLASYSCNAPKKIALSRLDPCMVFGYYCSSLESLVDLRSRIELLADDGMHTILSFDNGHAPLAYGTQQRLQDEDQADAQLPLLTKLPASDGECSPRDAGIADDGYVDTGCASSSSDRVETENGDIVLESGSSDSDSGDSDSDDDEWVTDL